MRRLGLGREGDLPALRDPIRGAVKGLLWVWENVDSLLCAARCCGLKLGLLEIGGWSATALLATARRIEAMCEY